MGHGYWNTSAYNAAAAGRRAAGKDDFGYSAAMRSVPRNQRKAAQILDPYAAVTREARDSADHPRSTPIAVLFDVTGSMRGVPVTVQRRLADLLGMLTRGGYVTDPQILIGAIGDDQYDAVPLQMGQFESDNRIDEQLREVYLEGGGGGDKREGYALAAYFMATRARTDAWDKRGEKGHLFLIGDEMNKERLLSSSVRRIIGDELSEDLSVEDVYRRLEERWNVYFVLPNLTSYYNDRQIEEHWRGLLGERFLRLENPDALCELIALTVGVTGHGVDLAEGVATLRRQGAKGAASAGRALAPLAKGRAVAARDGAVVPQAGGLLPADL